MKPNTKNFYMPWNVSLEITRIAHCFTFNINLYENLQYIWNFETLKLSSYKMEYRMQFKFKHSHVKCWKLLLIIIIIIIVEFMIHVIIADFLMGLNANTWIHHDIVITGKFGNLLLVSIDRLCIDRSLWWKTKTVESKTWLIINNDTSIFRAQNKAGNMTWSLFHASGQWLDSIIIIIIIVSQFAILMIRDSVGWQINDHMDIKCLAHCQQEKKFEKKNNI